ncbi:MAG: lysylphosphatidylglycerol synthase transmembrane domain-containing protein [Pirellulales bacterium]
MASSEEAPDRPKRRWGLLLRVLLSGALLGYLLSRLDRGALITAMADVEVTGWLLAVLLYLLSQIASGIRWATLARPVGFQLGWLRFQQLYFEGMFFSLCLPSSIGGDVVKALRLGGDGRGRVLAACTVVADRVAGLLAIMLIGFTALAQRSYSLSAAQTAGVGLVLTIAVLAGTRIGFALLDWPAGRIPNHHPIAHYLERLLPYHHHPYVFWGAIGLGLVVQGLNVLTVIALDRALGLDLPAEAYCIAVPLVGLMTALPISLNGVGVREGGLVWILATYGLTDALGVALGLLWFSVTVATGLIGGLVYLLGPPLKKPEKDSLATTQDDPDQEAAYCSAVN